MLLLIIYSSTRTITKVLTYFLASFAFAIFVLILIDYGIIRTLASAPADRGGARGGKTRNKMRKKGHAKAQAQSQTELAKSTRRRALICTSVLNVLYLLMLVVKYVYYYHYRIYAFFSSKQWNLTRPAFSYLENSELIGSLGIKSSEVVYDFVLPSVALAFVALNYFLHT